MLRAKIDPETKAILQWPVYDKDVVALLPNVSFPPEGPGDIDLSEYNLINVPINASPPPTQGADVSLGVPVWQGESLVRTYIVTDKPISEVRDRRVTEVNRLRDLKIDGGFMHEVEGETHLFQSAASDRENIGNLGLLATLKQAAGAQVGDLRWLDPEVDFAFITASNTQVPMDAHQMVALYQRGLAFKSALTFYARAIKDWLLAEDRTLAELVAFDPIQGWPQ